MTNHRFCSGFMLSMLCIASVAEATTIDIVATVDGTYSTSFGGRIDVTGPNVSMFNQFVSPASSGSGIGLFEFNLTGLGGTTLESATFLGSVLSSSDPLGNRPALPLDLSAYSGDGIVEAADAMRARLSAGAINVPTLGPFPILITVPLLPSSIQGFLGGYLGIHASCGCGILGSLTIASLESPLGLTPPTLRLVTSESQSTPVPEPATALLFGAGLAAVAARLRCHHR